MGNIKLLRRWVRRAGHRMGVLTDWEQVAEASQGQERTADWYDSRFATSAAFQAPYYISRYYFLWSIIADRIARSNISHVLEIGCGPGQFAELLRDQGIVSYTGLDFSPAAIEIAKARVPEFDFVVDDARTSDVYSRVAYEAIVCTEVLEHIEDDFSVLAQFGIGKRCLCTVPSFPYLSHVRNFSSVEEVQLRYGPFFDDLVVSSYHDSRLEHDYFYLIDGKRNSYGKAPSSPVLPPGELLRS